MREYVADIGPQWRSAAQMLAIGRAVRSSVRGNVASMGLRRGATTTVHIVTDAQPSTRGGVLPWKLAA